MENKKQKKPIRVPVILQMEALECGAASLAMILAYYRRWVPLERMRIDCGVSRDGSNAANVAAAARIYGMEVKSRSYGPTLIKKMATFPCIIWWNYNHFVVLDGFTKNKAVLNDPAMGRVSVSMEEFDASYSGLCLLMSPGEKFEPGGKPKSIWTFFKDRIQGNLSALVLIMIAATLAALAGVIIPVFSRVYSDRILAGDNPDWIVGFLLLFGAMVVFQFICQAFQAISVLRVTGKMAAMSNASFLHHLLWMPIEFFSQRLAGDLSSRQGENDNVAKTMTSQLAPTVIQIVLLVFYLVIMLQYSSLLTVIGIVTVIVNFYVSRVIANKRMEISRVQLRDDGKVTATTMSGIDMIETIKAAGAEDGFFERWSGYQASANRSEVAFGHVNQFLGPLPTLVQQASSVMVLSMGTWLIISGHMTAGVFLAFQAMMTAFLNPVNQLIAAGQSIQQMRSSMERIEDVMKYPADQQAELDDECGDVLAGARKLSGRIDIDHITFGYSRTAEPLIRDFSLHISPGSRVALVGGSGSGKSTIGKLISGLFDPWEGSITFDGKTRHEIPRAIFTGSLSVVDQEVVMFADTIENNICMWDSTIEDYDVILAAKDAKIYDDIMRHPKGFHHRLDEGGRNVSGGQRQRMEIARVLAGDPSIIIMDEATSALDAQTEFEVSEAIRARGITCIIVAHRLSTIRDCDEIIVLDQGRVAERGTHEELLRNGGLYNELVTTE